MELFLSSTILAESQWWVKIINFELIQGNAFWRFGLVGLVIIISLAVGKIAQFFISSYAANRDKKSGVTVVTLLLNCIAKPLAVVIFGLGLKVCKLFLVFGEDGISLTVEKTWIQVAQAVIALSVAYGIYKLVDIVEYYLLHLTGKTETKLDDMLVPVVRKALRVTIAIFASIYIVDNILDQNVKSILVGAGVGGIAIALAAKDTIANFFGSITIFADRPFQIDELIRVGDHYGSVEEVGFRSTKIRTLKGHLVTLPNSVIANTAVENVGQRPFIRRTSNITITYDSGLDKTKQAVAIIKEILAEVPEVNSDPEKLPRVYFSDFNDWSLNVYMSYWVKPVDYWLYQEVNERVNLEIMKRFEQAKIEFAFPSQTVYVKKD